MSDNLWAEIKRIWREIDILKSFDIPSSSPVWLKNPLTSTAWDGDAYSTTAKTLIDLSAVFGVPAGVKAVLIKFSVQDSASASTDTYLYLSPNNIAGSGISVSPIGINSRYNRGACVVPCNSDGDIYYQIAASGAGTFNVILQIWGYWI